MRAQRNRGNQTLTAIDPNTRLRKGLPILDVAAEMDHYNIQDPYRKSNKYYNGHYPGQGPHSPPTHHQNLSRVTPLRLTNLPLREPSAISTAKAETGFIPKGGIHLIKNPPLAQAHPNPPASSVAVLDDERHDR